MKLKAPAKINLFLNITGRREDGYHTLESFFAPLALADEITIEPADTIVIEVPGFDIKGNTAQKAAQLLHDFYKPKAGARITINKKIPIAAGLGGSSANAGAVLTALPKFWGVNSEYEDLKAIALQVGADVPYFLNPTPAYVSGIGEMIEPMRLDEALHIVIIYPGIELLTRDVYNAGSGVFSKSIINDKKTILENLFLGKNDLQASAIKLNPSIEGLLSEIKALQGCRVARMSGSGSACFGIFETEKAALDAKAAFEGRCFAYYEYLKV